MLWFVVFKKTLLIFFSKLLHRKWTIVILAVVIFLLAFAIRIAHCAIPKKNWGFQEFKAIIVVVLSNTI